MLLRLKAFSSVPLHRLASYHLVPVSLARKPKETCSSSCNMSLQIPPFLSFQRACIIYNTVEIVHTHTITASFCRKKRIPRMCGDKDYVILWSFVIRGQVMSLRICCAHTCSVGVDSIPIFSPTFAFIWRRPFQSSPMFFASHSLHLCCCKLDDCYCIFLSVSHLGFQRRQWNLWRASSLLTALALRGDSAILDVLMSHAVY